MKNIDLISPKQVMKRLSIPSSTLYRWIADGRFPKPIKIGPRRTAFRHTDIEQWLDRQAETVEVKIAEGHEDK